MSTFPTLPHQLSFSANSAVLERVLDFCDDLGGAWTIDALPSDVFLRIADTTNPALSILRAIEVSRGGGDLIMSADTETAVGVQMKFGDQFKITTRK